MLFFVICILIAIIKLSSIPVDAAYHVKYHNRDYTYDDIDLLKKRIDELDSRMERLNPTTPIYNKTKLSRDKYFLVYTNLQDKWQQKEKEYVVAAYVWSYLKEQGFSDIVTAGILGNMMVEVGGYTLDLDWDMWTGPFYGLCQWSGNYSTIWNGSVEEQCDFLLETIVEEFENFGFCYRRNFKYADFLKISSPEEAALAFAKCYERCSKDSYKLRQQCAVEAYNYFIK